MSQCACIHSGISDINVICIVPLSFVLSAVISYLHELSSLF